MRSSNLKHCTDVTYLKHCAKRKKFFRKTNSFIFAIIVAVSVIAVPCTTLAFTVYATSDDKTVAVVETQAETEEVSEKAVVKKAKVEKVEKKEKIKATEPETQETTVQETTAPTEPETVAETSEATEPAAQVSNTGYNPQYVSLSSYDREKLERLVTGEAGTLGYDGCVLVAQAIRDGMNLIGTSSIDTIIAEYQYSGSTTVEATADAKKAVSFIFDQNGYAVNHRILYFYATDIVSNAWHETQNYVTTCGNMKFFDKWD